MAQNDNFTLAINTWTLLTNSDVTALRVQNMGQHAVFLKATVGATPPSDTDGSIALMPGQAIEAGLTLEQLFPGVSGANRVYGRASDATVVSVSHA